jgi:endonuclease/exonuclease/phosphatase family metal-dependent hydrolase
MMLLLFLQVTVMTYNLRFDTINDGVNRWDARKEHVAALIRHEEPHFLGTQEGLRHQLDYLLSELPGFAFVGVGRDDGADSGEFSALFYDTTRVELLPGTAKTRWMSLTPDVPSKSWDAALPRIVTFARFRIRSTGDTLDVYNTHFDHVGQLAREQSARLILDWMRDESAGTDAILLGDFNVTPDNPAYEVLVSSPDVPLRDALTASESAPVGPAFTFEGFAVRNSTDARRIDYIFVSQHLRVLRHATISAFRDGRYPSDHLPVVAVIERNVSASITR